MLFQTTGFKQYTTLMAPLAWRACETFVPRADGRMVVIPASDVFMLGCTFVEVLTGCTRQPYDWLMAEDLSGFKLVAFRASDLTRDVTPIEVAHTSRSVAGVYGVPCSVCLSHS